MLVGCTGVAARQIGKMMAMTHENSIPGHLADPGKLSEIHELARVATIQMTFIWTR